MSLEDMIRIIDLLLEAYNDSLTDEQEDELNKLIIKYLHDRKKLA